MPAIVARAALPAMALLLTASAAGYADGETIRVQLNAIRATPPGYAAPLRAFRRGFDSSDAVEYHLPDDPTGYRTHEGVKAVDEAIAAVTATAPLPPLAPSAALMRAARAHVEAQGPTGATGHGSGAGGMPERIAAAGAGGGFAGEAISYGAANPADALRQLIVDDGVPSRGHRRILLSPTYRYVGVWCGPHAVYRSMCVLDFSSVPGAAPPPR